MCVGLKEIVKDTFKEGAAVVTAGTMALLPSIAMAGEQEATHRMVPLQDPDPGLAGIITPDGEWHIKNASKEFASLLADGYAAGQACSKDLALCISGLTFGRDPENECQFPGCPDAAIAPNGGVYHFGMDGDADWNGTARLVNPTGEDLDVMLYYTERSIPGRPNDGFDPERDPHLQLTVPAYGTLALDDLQRELIAKHQGVGTLRFIAGDGTYEGGKTNGPLPLIENTIERIDHATGDPLFGLTRNAEPLDSGYFDTDGTTVYTTLSGEHHHDSIVVETGPMGVAGRLIYIDSNGSRSEAPLDHYVPNDTLQLSERDLGRKFGFRLVPGAILGLEIDYGQAAAYRTSTSDLTGDPSMTRMLPMPDSAAYGRK